MKLSVFTVSAPDLTPEELAAAAKEAGIHGIEWRYKDVPADAAGEAPSFWRNNLCSIPEQGGAAEWDRFKAAADSQGLVSLSVTPYLSVGDLEATERVLAAARHIGASYIRLAVPGYNRTRNARELFDEGLAYLRQAAPLCKEYGVKGLIETHHNTISASASAAYRLVESFDPDTIGVLYDPGNMVYEGYENYRFGMELLGPYLAHVHVKNAVWKPSEEDGVWSAGWSPLFQGIVSWKQVIEDLQAIGYDGYLGVEDFSSQFGTKDMLRHYADHISRLL
ncbi:Sugar phosphate isomerase/epimerase [Paenibacillus sp. UNCCL117]|uniref:sugar phosphate isomerase/epimerase family protein n=1 Tax=unclassified Paenibacillus TaxID=185978 RepID=UPI000884FD2C|nr:MULTISPECIES: sugar phosphate isomerase/epimerase family protein [unclassified Paenibacillus]SDC67444.1 Sugar phosphate isomerase/epimerase [Paenibacillus sp. cl123]SFW23322.1 Sugar phosphate isomerase/epimerase [Paenibacillus sp. UNCCL117]